MELYRYLFAPILLAVAVWLGHHQRRPAPPPETPATASVTPIRPTVDPPAPSRFRAVPLSAHPHPDAAR